jgi:predicted acyltransferase
MFVVLGRTWNQWFPINKNLWTSSYVLYAGGWSFVLLSLFYSLFDGLQLQEKSRAVRALLWPLLVFGSNAIAAFLFSEIAVESLIWWKVTSSDPRILTAWSWIYFRGFARHASTENTSLAFALAFVVFCFFPNWLMWRRKLFLRI